MADNKDQAQYADLLAQVATQQSRADTAERNYATEKARADKAEGELASVRHKLEELEKSRIDTADVAKLKATIDGLTHQLASEKKARMDAESPDRLRAAVRERVKLETAALAVLGDGANFDALDDRALMTQVIEKLHGQVVGADKSSDYVRARFDAAIEGFQAGTAALARVRELSAVKTENSDTADAKSARQKMVERNQNAWRKSAEA